MSVLPLPVEEPVETRAPVGELLVDPKLRELLNNGERQFILTYDTSSQIVSSHYVFPEAVPFPVFKSVIINSLDSFVEEYAIMVREMLQASDEIRKKTLYGPPKESLMTNELGFNFIARATQRAEHASMRLSDYKGGYFEALLPTALIVKGNHQHVPEDQINMFQSKPYKNGILFVGNHPGY